jgi:hypothetical protein
LDKKKNDLKKSRLPRQKISPGTKNPIRPEALNRLPGLYQKAA